MPLTHKELVEIGAKFLLTTPLNIDYKQQYVATELKTYTNQILDVFGFRSGASIELECKTSHSDFLRNMKKPGKDLSFAHFRCFLCEPGIIKPEELPEKWGLLYTDGVTVTPIIKPEEQEVCYPGLNAILYSIIRRNIKTRRINLKGENND